MILDAYLLLADAQESTVSVASTSHIDTIAAGDANVGDWFVVRVGTAFVAGAGAPTAQFQLQTDDASDFDGGTTLAASSAFLAAALTVNTIVYKIRIAPGTLRYLRGYMVVDSGLEAKRFSAGTFDMFIVKDADINSLIEA